MKKVIFSALWSLLALNIAFAGQGEDKFQFKHGQRNYIFNHFEKIDDYHHYYGEYMNWVSLTGGINLHIFPNKKFIFTEWCDICPERKNIANGSYEFKNGKIFLNYKYISKENKKELKEKGFDVLHVLYGDGQEESECIEGLLSVLLSEEAYKEMKKGNLQPYMFKIVEYNDWKKIYNELK